MRRQRVGLESPRRLELALNEAQPVACGEDVARRPIGKEHMPAFIGNNRAERQVIEELLLQRFLGGTARSCVGDLLRLAQMEDKPAEEAELGWRERRQAERALDIELIVPLPGLRDLRADAFADAAIGEKAVEEKRIARIGIIAIEMRDVDAALVTRGFEKAPPRIDRRTERGIMSGEIGWQAAGALARRRRNLSWRKAKINRTRRAERLRDEAEHVTAQRRLLARRIDQSDRLVEQSIGSIEGCTRPRGKRSFHPFGLRIRARHFITS